MFTKRHFLGALVALLVVVGVARGATLAELQLQLVALQQQLIALLAQQSPDSAVPIPPAPGDSTTPFVDFYVSRQSGGISAKYRGEFTSFRGWVSLDWRTQNVSRCELRGPGLAAEDVPVNAYGRSVFLDSEGRHRYSLTCSGSGGTMSRNLGLTIIPAVAAPTFSILEPRAGATYAIGQTLTYRWKWDQTMPTSDGASMIKFIGPNGNYYDQEGRAISRDDVVMWGPANGSIIQVPDLPPGQYRLWVRAYGGSGTYEKTSDRFTITSSSVPVPTPTVSACGPYYNDLTIGSSGWEVLSLHAFLNGKFGFTSDALSGDYFSPATQVALARYQRSVGLPDTGYFGNLTRQHIAAICDSQPEVGANQPAVTVVVPNGGETWQAGGTGQVRWNSNVDGYVYIYLQFPDGSTCYLDRAQASAGVWATTLECAGTGQAIPNSSQYKILLEAYPRGQNIATARDTSNAYFTLSSTEVSPTPVTPTAPLTPTLTATTGASDAVALNWTGSGTGVTYDVYRSTSANAANPTLLRPGHTNLNWSDTTATAGTTYYYWVCAVPTQNPALYRCSGIVPGARLGGPVAPTPTPTPSPTPDPTPTPNPTPTPEAAPVVRFSAPSAGSSLSGTVSVAGLVQNANYPYTARFMVDGTTVSTAQVSSAFPRFTWDTINATNGSHALTISITDARNRSATSNSLSVTVNNQAAPTPQPTPPTPVPPSNAGSINAFYINNAGSATVSAGQNFTLSWSTTGCAQLMLTENQGWSTWNGTLTGTAVNGSGTYQITSPGTYYPTIVCQTAAGASFASRSITIYVVAASGGAPTINDVTTGCENGKPIATASWSGARDTSGNYWYAIIPGTSYTGGSNYYSGLGPNASMRSTWLRHASTGAALELTPGQSYLFRVSNGQYSPDRAFVAPSCAGASTAGLKQAAGVLGAVNSFLGLVNWAR